MTSQFPPDYNRPDPARQVPRDLSVWPRELRWSYWVFVAAAVVMVVSALAAFFGPGDTATGELADYLHANRQFMAWTNLAGALVIVLVAPQLARPMKHARTILAAVAGIVSFLNILAIAVRVGGLLLILIVLLLVAGLVLMYRPGPNAFVKEHTRPKF